MNNKATRVPWFKFTDLVFFPKFGGQISGRFLRNYYWYRKKLQTSSECSLIQFYPRSGYLLYYFLLFTWAEYCGFLDQLLARPQLSLLAESFMRYIVEADRIIDRHDGAVLLNSTIETIRRHPHLLLFRERFLSQVEKADLSIPVKHILIDETTRFEISCLKVCRASAGQVHRSIDEVLKEKEATAGALFNKWAAFLNIAYEIPQQYRLSSQLLFEHAGMALQMLDDTLDVPIDYDEKTANTFIYIVQEIEEEWKALQIYLSYLKQNSWHHLDTIWASQNTPTALSKMQVLSECYLDRMKSYDHPAVSSLRFVMERIKVHPVGI